MTDELFEGAIVEGKKFPFIRMTPNNQKRVLKKFRLTIRDTFLTKLFPQTINVRDWKRTRNVAFEKNFLWKWFRIIPKELRCNRILLTKAGEIQASFFDLCKATRIEYSKSLNSATPSQTKKEVES